MKEAYTDNELERLLKKPNMRSCAFAEYRTWVIINLLVNNGIRAATVRNIKNKDVDLENLVIYLRHTKSKKSQVIPLCTELCGILKEYMRIRGGGDDDFLFPTENGEQLTEHGLRSSIARYNNRRGIEKTSIHAFRHPYVKLKLKFLLTQHYRCIGAKVLDFPLNFKLVVGVNIHLVYKHICEFLCQGVFLFHCFCCLQSF